jgi:hypothetical protein
VAAGKVRMSTKPVLGVRLKGGGVGPALRPA